MHNEDAYFNNEHGTDLWQRYCGFLSLSLNEFIHIQQGLLKEQIGYLNKSEILRKMLPMKEISSIEEFRQSLPLRRYDDYAEMLEKEPEDILQEKPFFWVHTSSSRGKYKKVPWASRFDAVQLRNVISALILSAAGESGDVKVSPGCRILHLLPGRPFASATLAYGLVEQFSLRAIPPLGTECATFTKRIDKSMTLGVRENVDYVIAMTSSLNRMGQRFDTVWKKLKHNPLNYLTMHPQVIWRLISRKHGSTLYPVDVWALKGIVSWGVDSEELSGTIAQQWGRKPVQMYGSSEGGIMAMQDWRKGSMTLIPDTCYFEFLPEASLHVSNPKTVLIDELKEGQSYELIISNFYGMPFTRYRQGDLFRVERSDVPGGVPRFIFVGRADDSFDLFGIARVNTAIFSEALSKIGLSKDNWCIHKKYESNRVALDVFAETDQPISASSLDQTLNRAIKSIDRHWGEAVFTMAYNPIHVNLLPPGTFQKLGFHNNGSSPSRINPSELIVKELILASEAKR